MASVLFRVGRKGKVREVNIAGRRGKSSLEKGQRLFQKRRDVFFDLKERTESGVTRHVNCIHLRRGTPSTAGGKEEGVRLQKKKKVSHFIWGRCPTPIGKGRKNSVS